MTSVATIFVTSTALTTDFSTASLLSLDPTFTGTTHSRPGIARELIWESNEKIFWGEAVRLTDLPAGSWSGSGHLNRDHEAVDASPHPNGSVKASHFDLNINWDGLPGDTKGIYGLFRGWLAKGLEGRTCS